MYHGLINVYKEKGFTSHDVVAKLRGICKQKKIGHTGTLDPDAEGVLPVCLGSATRLCDMLTDKDKEYIAELYLGIETDTQDMSGKILNEKTVEASLEQVRKTIFSFEGEYDQVPPMYSALKVNGRKLYELAREGKVVERVARRVHIYSIEILKEAMPELTIRVNCSKGTYIRTLCHDIGQALLCGGTMKSLIRTKAGSFLLDNAHTLAEIQLLSDNGKLDEIITPIEEMFCELPSIQVKEEYLNHLNNGNQLYRGWVMEAAAAQDEQRYKTYSHSGKFYGIYRFDEFRNMYSPQKIFFT